MSNLLRGVNPALILRRSSHTVHELIPIIFNPLLSIHKMREPQIGQLLVILNDGIPCPFLLLKHPVVFLLLLLSCWDVVHIDGMRENMPSVSYYRF